MKQVIALAGATGLLGTAFRNRFGDRIISLNRSMLDIDDPEGVRHRLGEIGAGVIINCAAHTNLEAAERDPEPDRRANLVLPQILAKACEDTGATMVQLSSTGCYGRWKEEPYVETDPLRPTTVHHRHKAEAEEAVSNTRCSSLILRTGWLFGGRPDQPKNFVWKRIAEARKSSSMISDSSQVGVPTWIEDVVTQTWCLLNNDQTGIYNVTSQGRASRFDYVAAIVEASRLPCEVFPGPPFPRLAEVSPNEAAVNESLQKLGMDVMPEWRFAVRAYVSGLLASESRPS